MKRRVFRAPLPGGEQYALPSCASFQFIIWVFGKRWGLLVLSFSHLS
ncbi:hypothetical protein ABLN64_12185 [Mycobacterium tuberculosis]